MGAGQGKALFSEQEGLELGSLGKEQQEFLQWKSPEGVPPSVDGALMSHHLQ